MRDMDVTRKALCRCAIFAVGLTRF